MSNTETVSKADVLRYFFDGKVQDPKAQNRQFYLDLLAIADDAQFLTAVQSHWPEDDDNSVVGWTVGTRKFNNSAQVARWTKTEIAVDPIYSKGIDPPVAEMLEATRGNLKDLAHLLLPQTDWASQNRFQLERDPGDEFHIIGVRHDSSAHNGTVELLDGSHRLVALAAQGKASVKAYIADLK